MTKHLAPIAVAIAALGFPVETRADDFPRERVAIDVAPSLGVGTRVIALEPTIGVVAAF